MTRINHNIEAMVSHLALVRAERGTQGAQQKLSTGLRINRASDDPANLSVSEQLRTQIRGSSMVTTNAQDATSLLQIAEGAMDEVANILQRMRELTIQASNDTWTSTDRNYMDLEFQGLKTELDRIANQTQYNSMALLSGSINSFGSAGGPSVLHIGANNAIGIDTLTVSIHSMTAGALSLISANILVQPDIDAALLTVDDAIFMVNENRSYLGSMMNRLESAVTHLNQQQTNTQAADSVIRDADFAKLSTEMVRFQILTQASTAMLGQANSLPQSVLSLFNK
jgi:flagellin